jgi:hypothetical protein
MFNLQDAVLGPWADFATLPELVLLKVGRYVGLIFNPPWRHLRKAGLRVTCQLCPPVTGLVSFRKLSLSLAGFRDLYIISHFPISSALLVSSHFSCQ